MVMFGCSSMYLSYAASTPMVPNVVMVRVIFSSPPASPSSAAEEQPVATKASAATPARDVTILLRDAFTGFTSLCAWVGVGALAWTLLGALSVDFTETIRA